MNAAYGVEGEMSEPIKMKTASGEIVETGGKYQLLGKGEWGESLRLPGLKAPIHKPLAAAGAVTDKGSGIVLSKDGG